MIDDHRATALRAGCFPLILARARAAPAAPALVSDTQTISYGALMGAAATVADHLREQGIGPGDVVGIAFDRGPSLAAAILGAWAAGACYLPIDERHPAGVIADQLDQASAKLIVAERPWQSARPTVTIADSIVEADRDWRDLRSPDPDRPAYIMFTSGSTGRPKGVIATHRNLWSCSEAFRSALDVDASGAVAWLATITFDLCPFELVLALSAGARLAIGGPDVQTRPHELLALLTKHDVTVAEATPTAWRLVAGALTDELDGRHILSGGEPLPAALANRLLNGGCRLWNLYGTTESTVWSTMGELRHPAQDPISAGTALPGTTLLIIDDQGGESAPGEPGEVCVAGAGVTQGYVGSPALTASVFGSHPRHGRFYRTGDAGSLRPDGTLDLLGRMDRQIKLRGHRLELQQVEAVLHEHPGVLAAAVVLIGDPQSDGSLVAFVQPAAGADDLSRACGEHVRRFLPHYAWPARIDVVDALPTTFNGKTDYRALLRRTEERETASAENPRQSHGELVEQLTSLWKDVLGRTTIDPRDDFFLNGGNSLLAAQLVLRIGNSVGHEISMRTVFEHSTPLELATHLSLRKGPA